MKAENFLLFLYLPLYLPLVRRRDTPLRSVFPCDVGECVEDVLRGEWQRQPRARVARRDARLGITDISLELTALSKTFFFTK